jgi:hypothetical protein
MSRFCSLSQEEGMGWTGKECQIKGKNQGKGCSRRMLAPHYLDHDSGSACPRDMRAGITT